MSVCGDTLAGGVRSCSFEMERYPGFFVASVASQPSRRSELCYTPLSLETRIRLARHARQRQANKATYTSDHDKENASQHRNASSVGKGQQRPKAAALPLEQRVRTNRAHVVTLGHA